MAWATILSCWMRVGRSWTLPEQQRRRLADRHLGVGFDQMVTLENPVTPGADVFMRLHNADGSEARACGNATRCIAGRIMGEKAATSSDQ